MVSIVAWTSIVSIPKTQSTRRRDRLAVHTTLKMIVHEARGPTYLLTMGRLWSIQIEGQRRASGQQRCVCAYLVVSLIVRWLGLVACFVL